MAHPIRPRPRIPRTPPAGPATPVGPALARPAALDEIPTYGKVMVEAIMRRAESLGLLWHLRPATVVGPAPSGAPRVVLDGDTAVIKVVSLVGGLPVGGRVMVLKTPPSGHHVIGWMGGAAPPQVTVFTTVGAADFTPPPGWRYIRAYGVSGGGGGGGVTGAASGNGTGGGGGGGGYCESVFVPGDLEPTVTVTVGGGGGGALNGAGTGGTGGVTSFGSHWSILGGTGGTGSTATTGDTVGGRGLGGTPTGGNLLNTPGEPGELGRSLDNQLIFLGRGGASRLGFGGPAAVSVGSAGPAGQLYGGGGSGAIGSSTTRAGGSGADGVCVVEVHF